MTRKPTLYIAYGSNLNLPQMAYRCPTAEIVGTGEIANYELLFRGGRRGAVATIEPKEGSYVPVMLWNIYESDEKALDRYEGYPHLYDKQLLDVEINGQTITAMAYVMTPGHQLGLPSDHYLETIWTGYETAGLDVQILADAVDHAYELVAQQRQAEQEEWQNAFHLGSWEMK